jgi:hypothetical protein
MKTPGAGSKCDTKAGNFDQNFTSSYVAIADKLAVPLKPSTPVTAT